MITFVGAGPGDVELITVKGFKKLQEADIVIYAGSLVNPELLEKLDSHCTIHNSAYLNLEEIMEIMIQGEKEGKKVVRLHTGDTSIYGAVREQMDILRSKQISFEIVPGVSSFCGAAASLQEEYTLPAVTQTVILTRMEGKTEVPQKESIEALAKHNATMILFLSISMIEEAVQKLLKGYDRNTPAAVVYKATWKEEKIVRGTLADIAQKTKTAGITKTALIIVSHCMGSDYQLSKLYDKHFTTEFREGI